MKQSRRTFIKTGLFLSAGLPFIQNCTFPTSVAKSKDDLYELFLHPPVTAKPFVRWWWNGNKVAKAEILRELDVMKESGIGGVEINSILFPGGDDLGIPSLEWLSPEWIEMVKVALKGAEERDMVCDIIVGSGWPFGAEYLTPEEQTQLLTIGTRLLKGPGRVSIKKTELLADASPQVASGYDGATSELYRLCLAPVEMTEFSPAKEIFFNRNEEDLIIELPEGEYILYGLVKVTGFQSVINGSPGAAGPVLNHYNQAAVEKFLNRMSDHLFPAIKGMKGFRALFCDSMELEGANWCYDFPEEFKRRKGYDVEPYLPFILYKVGHMGNAVENAVITQLAGEAKEEVDRVRYDFFVACMEIVRDRFLIPYTQWCNRHGFKSRVQAYGREFHPLEASFDVDIPECETWVWLNDAEKELDLVKRPTYTNVNKFVSSAAHYVDKKLISCEEITNVDSVFTTTLERIKITGDQSNLSGVTHSILHGFNYNPPETPFPGWVRYGTYLNERNPWWPYFKLWSGYKARLSSILQNSEYVADIAVMHPLADMWTKHGPQRDPFPALHYPPYQYQIWEGIHTNGNSCDYISESVLQQSSFDKGCLVFNKRKYKTLILIEVETIMPETAEAIHSFVKSGGKLICIAKEPHLSPGWKEHKQADEKVRSYMDAMKQSWPSQVFLVDAPGEDVIQWFKNVQDKCGITPYIKIDNPTPYISQIRHKAGDKDIYFINNSSNREKTGFRATFHHTGKQPWLWNPETGDKTPYPVVSGTTLQVELPPATSQLIVFEKTEKKEFKTAPKPPRAQNALSLTGWKVRLEHMNGDITEQEIDSLKDWGEDEDTRSFAGRIVYQAIVDDSDTFNYLDLGKVYGVSEVAVNGEQLGCRWYGEHIYELPQHIAGAARKRIEITIVTTAGNYLKSSTENRVGQRWTRHQPWQPVGMLGPVQLS